MNSSESKLRAKTVRFVDVSASTSLPDWLAPPAGDPVFAGPEWPVAPLATLEVQSHDRHPLAPILESVRPPAPAAASPRFTSYPPGPGSQQPLANEALLGAEVPMPGAFAQPRLDTLIEELVPRVEEETFALISKAVEQFAASRARQLEASEAELVTLVKTICRRVLSRELAQNPLVIEGLIVEGLRALGGGDKLTVRLGPFFTDTVEMLRENLRHKGIECVVHIDPSVGQQGCRIETELGRVDESVETRLSLLLSRLDAVP